MSHKAVIFFLAVGMIVLFLIVEDTRKPRYIITVWGIGYKLGELR